MNPIKKSNKNPFSLLFLATGAGMEKIIKGKSLHEMGIVAKKFKPEFIVSTGDNIYPNGVRSTRDHNWIASFENIYTAQSLQTDWYVVLGQP